jgi:hypothetical protein
MNLLIDGRYFIPLKNETRVTIYYNIAMINIKQDNDETTLINLQQVEKLIFTKIIDTEA